MRDGKMKKRIALLTGALFLSVSVFAVAQKAGVKIPAPVKESAPVATESNTRDYKRIVVVSDAHYPSKTRTQPARDNIIAHKLTMAKDVNKWQDVDLLVFTGDIVQRTGNMWEYQEAKDFTDKFTAPKAFIPGNHAFMFASKLVNGKAVRASLEERKIKLARFAKTFGLERLYYGKEMAGYYLVFLSPEIASGKYPTELSKEELAWFKKTLREHKDMPTICFFHAPLKGSLENYNKNINTDYYVAHPVQELEKIFAANPQIMLWVSGHTHTKATNKSFAAPVNKVDSVVDIHNPSWESKTIWTNSLYLYPDKIVVRTYNHDKHDFVKKLDRTFYVKQPAEEAKAA
jgi:predicted MPP superfamily phosphohydrolase